MAIFQSPAGTSTYKIWKSTPPGSRPPGKWQIVCELQNDILELVKILWYIPHISSINPGVSTRTVYGYSVNSDTQILLLIEIKEQVPIQSDSWNHCSNRNQLLLEDHNKFDTPLSNVTKACGQTANIPWAECKTIASATYDTLAFSIWTLPECKSVVSANFYFLFFSVNLVF